MTDMPRRDVSSEVKAPRVLRYQLVVELIERLISDGGLGPGDKLPSVAELAGLADVSVISVRRALDELAHAARIVRHQGVGTFVAGPKIVAEPGRPGSLLQTMQGSRIDLTTELIGIEIGLPSAAYAQALGIETAQPVWQVSRLRRTDNRPRVLERAVLPLSVVPALDEERLSAGESLYDYLAEHYGFTEDFVEEAIEVDQPDAWEREWLQLGPRDIVVRIRGLSVAANGMVFDSFQQSYQARDFVFYTSGPSRQRLMGPTSAGPWEVRTLGSRPTSRR
jgi:GntR family transcriptional regulator